LVGKIIEGLRRHLPSYHMMVPVFRGQRATCNYPQRSGPEAPRHRSRRVVGSKRSSGVIVFAKTYPADGLDPFVKPFNKETVPGSAIDLWAGLHHSSLGKDWADLAQNQSTEHCCYRGLVFSIT